MFNIVTGVWPLISLRTFEAITGPKLEGWLVKTAGVLIAGVGATLVSAGATRRVTPEIALLATSTAGGLAAIDIVYAGMRRRISPVYLVDAALELAIVGGWMTLLFSRRGMRAAPPLEHATSEASRNAVPRGMAHF